MRLPPCLILSGLVLAAVGCRGPAPPIVAADKARFVTELIETLPPCASFTKRLSAPKIELAAIDRIYGEARSAGCVKKDI